MNIDPEQLHALAREEVADTLDALPEALRERASTLPVTYLERPSFELQADGIASDTLGLFVGPEFAEEESTTTPLPPQIILFLENIWEQAEGDEELFLEEVHTTYLHELGHYLGLNEEDLYERGLE